ncbi:MAG: cation:proton antiporter [Candidatus Thalassarchaeum sp.]|nr:cation:proton antiporter [Candidatus Thalassarchaeum sp.]
MATEGIVDQNFISLMFVLLAAFLVPILLSRNSKVKLPIVVGEIIAGLILGPSVLDLVSLDGDVILFMRDFGLAFLMFIAGMEIDFNALDKIAKESRARVDLAFYQNPIFLGPASFGLTLVTSVFLSFMIVGWGFIDDAWMMALILSTTSLGVVLPVLKERHLSDTRLGQTILLTALLADFVTMLLISLYATYLSEGGLEVEMLLVFLLFLAFAALHRTGKVLGSLPWISDLIEELSHATAQIKLRASLALMVGFIVLAEVLNTEMILGAFIAGVIISLLTTSPERRVERDLEAFGFSFFIPIFFVLVGVGFNLRELASSEQARLLVPLLLGAAIAVKFVPALIFRFAFSWRESIAAGSLLSARLSLIIAASLIALDLELVDEATNSAIILVAIITVIFAPMLFAVMIPETEERLSQREKGEVALKRFLTIIDDLGDEFEKEDLMAMFDNIDVNHDGHLDIHEFVAVFEGDLHIDEDDTL